MLEEPTLLDFFGHHLVGLCGVYEYVNDQGKPTKEPSYYCYTATVLSLSGEWYIATAGHCLENLEKASKHKEIRISHQALVDYNGFAAKVRMPTPFEPLDQDPFHIFREDVGFDFGLVPLRPLFRAGLGANKVIPFGPPQFMSPDRPFDGYRLVGFPEEFVQIERAGGRIVGGRIKLSMIPLEQEPDDSGLPFTRFKGRIIDKGNQQRIQGMSGGPILGYYQTADGDVKYHLVALQSMVTRDQTAVFGCPVGEFLRLFAEATSGDESDAPT